MLNANGYIGHNRPDPRTKVLKLARPFLVVVDYDDSTVNHLRELGPRPDTSRAVKIDRSTNEPGSETDDLSSRRL
jgi:hypothetical protein